MYATKNKADDGVLFPVKIKGTKVPMAIRIYGSDSDVVKDYERQRIRKIGLKGKEIDEETIDELLETQDDGVIVRIAEIVSYDWKKKSISNEELVLNGREITNDKASYEFLLENFPALKDFILDKSNGRDNFLG